MQHATTIKGHSMKNARGMTLIELSVVMLLIMMAASLTLPLFTGIAQSTRNQITEARVTQIKQAIINVQTVNGTPTVSGFVADVGRLPYCIQELINGICPPNITSIIGPNIWKGPYIQTSDGSFYDGWGNPKLAPDDGNFGWFFSLTSMAYNTTTPTPPILSCPGYTGPCDTLALQSRGADGLLTNIAPANPPTYDDDYPYNNSSGVQPSLIQPSDWIIDLSTTGLNVQFNHPPSLILPSIITTCTPGVATYPATNLTGTYVTSTCPIGTTSVTNTITCPAGYNAFGAPPPTVVGQNANIFCQSATTGNIYTSTITCSNNLTPPTVAALTAALPASSLPTVQTVTATCSSLAPSVATVTTTTPISQLCATGVPVTLLILANNLYGNSIIPTSIPALPLWPLPSTCVQSNTINFNDSLAAAITATPMAIGNWNICAFQSSSILTTAAPAVIPTYPTDFPSSFVSFPTCPSGVSPVIPAVAGTPYLSTENALYSGTIAVIPRTQPSIAW